MRLPSIAYFIASSLLALFQPRLARAQGLESPEAVSSEASAELPAACVPSCRSGYVCVSGTCVSACNPVCGPGERCLVNGECEPIAPPAVAFAGSAAPSNAASRLAAPSNEPTPGLMTTAVPEPSADSHVTLHMNALGFLQLGPTPSVELGGRNGSVSFRARLMNAGLLSHILAADPTDDEKFVFGIGVAAALRWYAAPTGSMRGLFFGAAVEYVSTEVEDSVSEMERYTSNGLVPQLELGYRWALGTFLCAVGGGAGYYFELAQRTEPLTGGEEFAIDDQYDNSSFYALANVELGFYL